MPFYKLYYHLVWSTKHRQPLLTPSIEPIVYDLLRSKAANLGAHVHSIGGIEDHVHMVVTIPPKIAVAKFVGQVKAVAATRFNRLNNPRASLVWQNDYAAFTFDEKRLHNYVAYAQRQKEHHASNQVIPILEQSDSKKQVNEVCPDYVISYESWLIEMEQWS